jgi:hypothetical protein
MAMEDPLSHPSCYKQDAVHDHTHQRDCSLVDLQHVISHIECTVLLQPAYQVVGAQVVLYAFQGGVSLVFSQKYKDYYM